MSLLTEGMTPQPVPAPERLAYRLLTGADDHAFCERVSAALADGYVLFGGPSVAVRGSTVVCAQAVVLPGVLEQAFPVVAEPLVAGPAAEEQGE